MLTSLVVRNSFAQSVGKQRSHKAPQVILPHVPRGALAQRRSNPLAEPEKDKKEGGGGGNIFHGGCDSPVVEEGSIG